MHIRQLDNLKEELYYFEVNGLKTYLIPKKDFNKSFAMYTVDYGSNDIKFSINPDMPMKEYPLGIAHFLEHKLFEDKEKNIFTKFSSYGASPNAYTNFENTSYYFSSTSNFEECLKLLTNFVFNPYFTKENVEKEKGIIEQEIRMYDDNPQFKVYFNLLQNMYKHHPVRNDIAGNVESIRKITPELLYECYNTFYTPTNMILVVVGNINVDNIKEILQETVPQKEDFKAVKFHYSSKENIENHNITENMELSIPNFITAFKDVRDYSNSREMLRKKIIMGLFGRMYLGRTSELFDKMYNKNLINDSFSYEYTIEKDYAYLLMGGESKDAIEFNKYFLENIKSHYNKPEKTEEFERAKKALLGSYIYRFNSIEGIGNFISKYLIRGIDIFEYKELMETIDFHHILQEVEKLVTEENNVISIVK